MAIRTVAVMKRKKAWITAGVVAVTFSTSALAVMANTGLLTISPSARGVGQLTPSDITVTQLVRSTTLDSKPEVTIRYEDVFVSAPADGSLPQPQPTVTPSSTLVAKSTGPVLGNRATTPTGEHELARPNKTNEGADDDD